MTTSRALDWNGVMNALAGTTGLDAQLAANIYAGWNYTKNGMLDLVGALAFKVGDPTNQRSLNALCNQIAGLAPGTLDALAALNYAFYGHWPV